MVAGGRQTGAAVALPIGAGLGLRPLISVGVDSLDKACELILSGMDDFGLVGEAPRGDIGSILR